jgi:hypothetical protein
LCPGFGPGNIPEGRNRARRLDPNAIKSGDAAVAAELEGIWFKSTLRNDRIK